MKRFILIAFAFLSIVGCREEVEPTVFEETPTPDPIPVWGDELFLQAQIDGASKNWRNDGVTGNGIDSAWYTVCSDTTLDRLKGQSTYWGAFSALDTGALNWISIELLGCAPFYEMDIDKDSIIRLGSYDYGSSIDTLQGVVITFADDTGLVWSTQYPPGNFTPQPQTSKFIIRELLQNHDGFSAYTMAGEMECVLYDTNGNSILLNNGQFISRIGRAY